MTNPNSSWGDLLIKIKKPDLMDTIVSVSKRIEKSGDFDISEENLKKIILLCEEYKYHKTNANDLFSDRVDQILDQILEEGN
tara:strand:+ start:40 stop:285 length:246 start_codon:yes stop_codon:yes gene_type:complete